MVKVPVALTAVLILVTGLALIALAKALLVRQEK